MRLYRLWCLEAYDRKLIRLARVLNYYSHLNGFMRLSTRLGAYVRKLCQ